MTKPTDTKFRLYVDEVGNPGLGASEDPKQRYLSLTGVAIELAYVASDVAPALEKLKIEFFGSHPDEPVVLHRKELVNKKPPFHALRDPATEARFNQALLGLITDLEYTVITVVIDKLEQIQRYKVWRYDPYHYCLKVLVEKYVLWLGQLRVGDVMAESRGGKEDLRLRASFERVCAEGTEYVATSEVQARLTSSQLKVKPKANNIAGLQLADLLAHPSFVATRARHQNQALPENFGGQIAAILERTKYRRSPGGKIDGWGRKWLP
ncbi:MAG: DUF3800 domain-containing protein [Thermoanaerobaculaceae bacterium]